MSSLALEVEVTVAGKENLVIGELSIEQLSFRGRSFTNANSRPKSYRLGPALAFAITVQQHLVSASCSTA